MAQAASANSLDAWSIGLSVAVEGLASLIKIEQDEAERRRLKDLQRHVLSEVRSHEEFRGFANRVQGCLSGLDKVRPADRLNWLVKLGITEQRLVRTWRTLRNSSVHPVDAGDMDLASASFQNKIDEIHSVVTLMYQIVFYLIGYEGPYTDYSQRGYATKDFHGATKLA